nr:hypothetical protein ABT39_MTgene241 [Picea glauca]
MISLYLQQAKGLNQMQLVLTLATRSFTRYYATESEIGSSATRSAALAAGPG